jgi:hypothetical protein
MRSTLFNLLIRRQYSTVPVLGTIQVLVVEVFLLFQPKNVSEAPAQNIRIHIALNF